MKRYTIKKIKDSVVEEITFFDKNKILNEVDKILSSHKMYDKYVNEIFYRGITKRRESIWKGNLNTGKAIIFSTPLIQINCTSVEAKFVVTRLMRKEGFETSDFSSFGIVVYKWDEDKIFQLTIIKEKK